MREDPDLRLPPVLEKFGAALLERMHEVEAEAESAPGRGRRRSGWLARASVGGVVSAVTVAMSIVIAGGAVLLLSHRSPTRASTGQGDSVSLGRSVAADAPSRSAAAERAVAGVGARDLIAARVIGDDPVIGPRMLLLDRGSEDGVMSGQPVLADGGLVGTISAVNRRSATVTLVSSPKFAIAAYIRGSGLAGILVTPAGRTTGTLELEDPVADQTFSAGDLLVSDRWRTAASALQIPVGTITSITSGLGPEPQVRVAPAVAVRDLAAVEVLRAGEAPQPQGRLEKTAGQKGRNSMQVARKGAVVATALVTAIAAAPAGASSDTSPVPQSPSIASRLSPAVAAVPGIVAFLRSAVPKSVEQDATTGQVVWVGTGNASWTTDGWAYPSNGVTIAGTYQPNPNDSNPAQSPATWPTDPALAVQLVANEGADR